MRIRLSLGMNRDEFARAAKLNKNAPRRYEDMSAKEFSVPLKKSWNAIRDYLDSIRYFEKQTKDGVDVPVFVPRPKLVMPETQFKTIWQPVNGRIYHGAKTQ